MACSPLTLTHPCVLGGVYMLLQVQGMLNTYAVKYQSLKAPRKLQWLPNLGTVSLELSIGDQQLEFTVRSERTAEPAAESNWCSPPRPVS